MKRTVVVERELPYPPGKIWRALTEPTLLGEWLMQNDFRAAVGHAFTLRTTPTPHFDGVIACEVLAVEPPAKLSYTWRSSGVDTVVTFTLTPTPTGTRLRMEQAGFDEAHPSSWKGAEYGWPRFLDALAATVGKA
jgi:uncharacterized protein YndB with AHSA1/START domain